MAVNSTGKVIITDLPFMSCPLINLPFKDNEIRLDCSQNNNITECIRCVFQGRFFSKEGINDTGSIGHNICIFLWIVTLCTGTLSTIGNTILIFVLRARHSGKAFDLFLLVLAICDLVCGILTIFTATSLIIYTQNWDRGVYTLNIFLYSVPLTVFARSGSAFLTVVITIERYLVIAFPLKFWKWFTMKRTRSIIALVMLWSAIMSVPRFSSFVVKPNTFGRNIPSTKLLDYIIVPTSLENFWYFTLCGFFDVIDYWAPLPLLLLFNGLLYYHIRKFNVTRKALNAKHRKDIRTAKMFLPVVIVLFLCNVEPIIYFYFIVNRTIYAELAFGTLVSWNVNSSVNLPIYYLGGSNFQKETRILLSKLFTCCRLGSYEVKANQISVCSKDVASKSEDSRDNDGY